MDFLHRSANGQPQAVRSNGASQSQAAAVETTNSRNKKGGFSDPRWLRVAIFVLLLSLTVLAIAIAFLFYVGKPSESHFVDKKKEQAVFLTNGQVYFGKIVDLNSKFINLQGIYYLNSQQQPDTSKASTATPTSFSLVKLGCELHGPTDQMIINRDQVSFWENLTTAGKVSKAIDQWVSQNPNGQNCDTSSSNNSTQQSTPTAATPNTKQ